MTPVLAEKIKTFTKLAVDAVAELEEKIAEYQATEKVVAQQKEAYVKALEKAAKALYDSDFITDDDGASFVKRAQDNPVHLANIIKKLCEASDVMTMGKVSSVRSIDDSKDFDPVKARAFGHKRGTDYTILDDI